MKQWWTACLFVLALSQVTLAQTRPAPPTLPLASGDSKSKSGDSKSKQDEDPWNTPQFSGVPTQEFVAERLAQDAAAFALKSPPFYGYLHPWPVHFELEAGFYFFQPIFQHNPAYTAVQGVPPSLTTQDFSFDPAFSPRISFSAVMDCGWGFRTSWWRFDEHTETGVFHNTDRTLSTQIETVPIIGVPGFVSPGPVARSFGVFSDIMNIKDHFKLDVWDWELTRMVQSGFWTYELAGGLRYVYLSQGYQAFRLNTGRSTRGPVRANIIADSDAIYYAHNFSGLGPTGQFELRRALGSSGLSLYSNARWSVLFGEAGSDAVQRTLLSQQVIPTTGRARQLITTSIEQRTTRRDDVINGGEVEAGVDYVHDFGRLRTFMRAGFAGQTWFNAGSATSEHGTLGLLGLTVTAGLHY